MDTVDTGQLVWHSINSLLYLPLLIQRSLSVRLYLSVSHDCDSRPFQRGVRQVVARAFRWNGAHHARIGQEADVTGHQATHGEAARQVPVLQFMRYGFQS
jgi:hypothetical protein